MIREYTRIHYRIACDQCGILAPTPRVPREPEEASADALEEGWIRHTWWNGLAYISHDLCPSCALTWESDQFQRAEQLLAGQ